MRRSGVTQAWLQASLKPERGVTWAQAWRERIGNASILSACSIYRPGEVYALANMQRADVIEKERAGQYCKSATLFLIEDDMVWFITTWGYVTFVTRVWSIMLLFTDYIQYVDSMVFNNKIVSNSHRFIMHAQPCINVIFIIHKNGCTTPYFEQNEFPEGVWFFILHVMYHHIGN